MRSFLLRCAVFGLLTAALTALGNRLVLRAGAVYKDRAAQVCARKRELVRAGRFTTSPAARPNVVFLGDSRVLCGALPAAFEEALGGRVHALNLALPALTIGPHYFEMKEYLGRNPAPRYVVVALAAITVRAIEDRVARYAGEGVLWPEEALSYALGSGDPSAALHHLLPASLYGDQVFAYLRDRLLHPQALRRRVALTERSLGEMERDRGYYFIGGLDIPILLLPDREQLAFERDPYVRKFLDLMEAYRVSVLLTEPPQHPQWGRTRAALPWQYARLLDRYSMTRMARAGWRGRIYEAGLFIDRRHLNRAGAQRWSRDLAQELAEAFGAP